MTALGYILKGEGVQTADAPPFAHTDVGGYGNDLHIAEFFEIPHLIGHFNALHSPTGGGAGERQGVTGVHIILVVEAKYVNALLRNGHEGDPLRGYRNACIHHLGFELILLGVGIGKRGTLIKPGYQHRCTAGLGMTCFGMAEGVGTACERGHKTVSRCIDKDTR